jgi:uncharacterized protein
MAFIEKDLLVKKSTIPGAGKGLFTKRFIPKGTRIAEYKGKVSTWKEVDDQDGLNAYIYYINRFHVIDSSRHTKNFARYANDAKGCRNGTKLANNCKYTIAGNRVFLESKKDVPAKSELLVGYGKEYWDILLYNKSQAARKKKKIAKVQNKF